MVHAIHDTSLPTISKEILILLFSTEQKAEPALFFIAYSYGKIPNAKKGECWLEKNVYLMYELDIVILQ